MSDMVITWIRRDRLGEELPDGSAIAMSDPPERYEIDIMSADSPPVVLRTLTSTVESATYTTAQQLTDFGSATSVTVDVHVYQMSAIVGRGTPGDATINVQVDAASGAPFVVDTADNPMAIAVLAAGRFLIGRTGTLDTVPALGIYETDGVAGSALIESTYDGRFGLGGSADYVPSTYNPALDIRVPTFWPIVAVGADDGFAFAWPVTLLAPSLTNQFLMTGDATASPMGMSVVPTSENISAANLCGLIRIGATTYAMCAGDRVFSSPDGATWTDEGTTTGYFQPSTGITLGISDYMKLFEFDGQTYSFSTFGLAVNAANDLVDWAEVVVFTLGGAYSSWAFIDVAISATAIVIIATGTLTADGELYNLFFRSTDGATFTVVRSVIKDDDIAPSFAFNLGWEFVLPLGSGFSVYGRNPSSGVLPYVIASTDDGATWGTMAPLDLADGTNNAVLNHSISDGTTILGTRNKLGDAARLVVSTDGEAFTDL